MSKIIHTSGSDHITNEMFSDGPETFTVAEVTEVVIDAGKERHAIRLKEIEGKTWVPAFTIIKALARIWTMQKSNWVGQKITLYQDKTVKVGKETVGGIRVSHITGITEKQTVKVKGALNRNVTYTFEPIAASIEPETWQQITAAVAQQGIEQTPGQWASQQLGRKLSSPEDITAEEGERLLQVLTTGETP